MDSLITKIESAPGGSRKLSVAAFAALVTLLLAMNDWGRSAPPEAAQIFWGLAIAVWPFIVGVAIWPRR